MSEHRAVRIARTWIGTPFRAGARVRGQGVDCLQFLAAIYEEYHGERLPRMPLYNVSWFDHAKEEIYLRGVGKYANPVGRNWDELRIGDILLFRMNPKAIAKHCAILSAPDKMIHVLMPGYVEETPTLGYKRKLAGAFRWRS